MTRYTLYLHDDRNVSIVEELACGSDGEAINAMNDRAQGRAAELWRDDHKILGRAADATAAGAPLWAPRRSRRARGSVTA
jgi:hypothetical protein